MFGKRNGRAVAANIDCLISAKTRIEGNVLFEGGLRVDGQVKGNLTAHGDQAAVLVISEHARLEGEVRAAQAIINGTVHGTVQVSDRLELQAKARITGDVHYRTLEMHPGAVVEGRLIHQADASAGAAESAAPTPEFDLKL